MHLRVRKNARHAKPSKAAPTVVAAGLSASFVVADAAAMATAASATASDSDLAKLRACESGGNYRANTGNGYYGAYQFALSTWHGLGYSGRPDQASAATQDAAVRKLQARSGWGQWPACSRRYGLGSSTGSRETARADRSRPVVHVAAAPAAPPRFDGHLLTVADVRHSRADARAWQARMKARGWTITVDGYFGPQSSRVARKFAAEKHLRHAGLPGEVDKVVWDAAWRLPVS